MKAYILLHSQFSLSESLVLAGKQCKKMEVMSMQFRPTVFRLSAFDYLGQQPSDCRHLIGNQEAVSLILTVIVLFFALLYGAHK